MQQKVHKFCFGIYCEWPPVNSQYDPVLTKNCMVPTAYLSAGILIFWNSHPNHSLSFVCRNWDFSSSHIQILPVSSTNQFQRTKPVSALITAMTLIFGISDFCVAVTRISSRNNFKEERFILASESLSLLWWEGTGVAEPFTCGMRSVASPSWPVSSG